MPETTLQEVNRLIEQVGAARIQREIGVHRTTLLRWRRGTVAVPAAQLRALRALAYDTGTHPAWEGWRIRDGKLHSPEGYTFTPGELLALPYVYGERNSLRDRVKDLEATVAALSVDPHVRGDSANDAATAVGSQPRVA
jgi:Phage protein